VTTLFANKDQNFITKNKGNLSGLLNIASSRTIDFRLLKCLSKTVNFTINDIVTSALSTSMNTIFKENKDPNKSFKCVIPANIRFKFYATPEQVKLENKFAVVPLTVPLCENMETAYKKIQNATKHLKHSISYVYAMYALAYWANILVPRFVPKAFVDIMSNKYTISFSNTPGPIKPFYYTGEHG
jgi:NRPS condensation-like uncharacterized protein